MPGSALHCCLDLPAALDWVVLLRLLLLDLRSNRVLCSAAGVVQQQVTH
jgi:hypothetical protein